MFIVANRVPVASGWEDSFEERFQKRAGQIDKQPGFVRMQILKPESNDTPYVVLTTWQDKASFEVWVGSEDFKLSHSNPMPKEAFDGEGKMEMHKVIIDAES
ncbi:MAG: antibiotic biosynthesis monooxygenase family protein [Pseudomonadota bacterium]|nr:antibiotic biosynthesis monooxygenase family protein [Pseudomonadota bacterium]